MTFGLDCGPSMGFASAEGLTYSLDTKIFIWPALRDKTVSRRMLVDLVRFTIDSIAPTAVGRGFFPRQYVLLYQPKKQMTEQDLSAFRTRASESLSNCLGLPDLRVSYDIQDKTNGHYSAGECVTGLQK